ncbi:MAG: hypothetical protein M1144_05565, partial [Candidatus Thermoplasmatota archaeon]|nr:hypothetical protein [Candidatus Thermoplasmatota archaeon]
MSGKGRLRRMGGWVLGAIVILLMGGLLTSSVAATTIPGQFGNGNNTWAYGGSRTVSGNGTIVTMSGQSAEYTITSHVAMSVLFNQTNTSSTTFQVIGLRTVGFTYSVQFCRPSCSAPSETMKINASGWDQEWAYANFTRNGTVYENGLPVPAFALSNVSDSERSNLTVVASWSGTYTGHAYASASAHSQASVAFTTALGLFPIDPTPGSQWSSAANFTGNGQWTVQFYMDTSMRGTSSGTHTGTLQRNGTAYLSGVDTGNATLPNGQGAYEIAFHLLAPFRLSDGIFLMPLDGDLFGSMMQMPWGSMIGSLGMNLGTDTVDYDHGMGHFGLASARLGYLPTAN